MKDQINTIRKALELGAGAPEALAALAELERMAGEPVADINVRPSESGGTIASVFSHKLPVGSWLVFAAPPAQQPQWEIKIGDEWVEVGADNAAEARSAGVDVRRIAQQPQADRSGCAAGSDEECANRHCATRCPAVKQQAEAVPQKHPQPEGMTCNTCRWGDNPSDACIGCEQQRDDPQHEGSWQPIHQPQAEAGPPIQECYGDCPTNPATCKNPCKFNGRPAPQQPEAVPSDVVRDAARYRWLRNESWAGYNTGKGTPSVYTVDGAGNRRMMLAEEAMDDAIDAAMAQGEKP